MVEKPQMGNKTNDQNGNIPKVRTITLGGRGCETARERKSVKMSINWE